MADKTSWTLLLLLAIGISGCAQPPMDDNSAGGSKQQSAQAKKDPSRKTPLTYEEAKESSVTLRTPDMPEYHWPADFKLPLVITIKTPEVPKEIEGPSPPIKEEKNSPEKKEAEGQK